MIWDSLPLSEQPLPAADPAPATASTGVVVHQALYRKWRSRSFDDVVGQEHVTRTLANAVAAGTVGHAYLFTGSRGTGKTSTARVLARAVNCLAPRDGNPCNACRICTSMEERRSLDLVEIDAASNNSVEDVRDLREKVGYAPSEARRKVYVIDEVHMLSSSAFNALLKTLEEPPRHVLFVLATTEIQRVPPTIVSRCQRFDFRPITPADTMARLAFVCAQEALTIDQEALEMLARYATGSLRDALGLLDQVRAYSPDHVSVADVQESLGLADPRALQDLARTLLAGDLGSALGLVEAQAGQGADLRQLGRQAVAYWRDLLVARARNEWPPVLGGPPPTPSAIAGVIRAFLQADAGAKRSTSAGLHLELALLDAIASLAPATVAPQPAAVAPATTPQGRVAPPPVSREAPRSREAVRERDTPAAPPSSAQTAPAAVEREEGAAETVPAALSATPLTIEAVRAVWPRACEALRRSKPRIAALLNGSCRPLEVDAEGLVLGFLPDFGFHRGQIEDPAKRGAVEEALEGQLGQACRIRCVMIESGEGSGRGGVATGSAVRVAPDSRPSRGVRETPTPPLSTPDPEPTIESGARVSEEAVVVPDQGVLGGTASADGAKAAEAEDFVQLAARALREVHVDRNPVARLPLDLSAEG